MEISVPEKKLTRVDRLIRAAFAELLQKKEFPKIKVSEIIAKAEVSRSAFYAHYVDIYDLIGQIEQELFSGFQARMLQVQVSGTEYRDCPSEDLITGKYEKAYFEYIREQKVWWELFMSGRGRADFVPRFTHVIYSQLVESTRLWDDPIDPSIPQVTTLVMAAWTYVGVISYWLETGMRESPLDMGRVLAVYWYRFLYQEKK
ncbi:MAG: TetR/AcrR family transcriptional regulator [Oscillospiraceae bacterium]|nr:TetR/AcrR family transcriptional regulator [Oscillospiraceae bacterium]